jgi:hypothetical protein
MNEPGGCCWDEAWNEGRGDVRQSHEQVHNLFIDEEMWVGINSYRRIKQPETGSMRNGSKC